MPLTLSLLDASDAHAFAVVDDAAMAGWPYAIAMGLNLPGPRIQMVEDWVRHGLQEDSTQTYLQVSDDETGEMVAGAMWRFTPVGEGDGKKSESEVDDDGKKTSEKKAEQDERAGMAAAFAAARKEMWEEFEGTFFPGESYANLQILVTTPAHRRRGAASQLIKWGTQRADERGLKSVLMASEAGLSAYLKHGFRVVREVEMDLRPFGVDATEWRRWMVREPVKPVLES